MKVIYRSKALETYLSGRDTLNNGNIYSSLLLFKACAVNTLSYITENELNIKVSPDTKLKRLISMVEGHVDTEILNAVSYLDSIEIGTDIYSVDIDVNRIKHSLKHLIGEKLAEHV